MAFPASKYARYKRATAFFLDWLLRARGHRRNDKRVELETLNEVVNEISSEPSMLAPKLLTDFPKALAACQCAITLREHVAAFFADGEHGHQHFLQQLKIWLNILKKVEVEPEEEGNYTVKMESTKFENYYDALEVDEDYFPDEGTYVPEPSASVNFKVDRQRLLEEAFAEDMRLEVVYFFLELQELLDTVFDMYTQVKKQQRTILEATVVTKLAIDTANSLTATLQLRYPSLRTGLDCFKAITKTEMDVLSESMNQAFCAVWKTMSEDGVYKPASGLGMFLVEFMSMGITLEAFMPLIPPKLQYGIRLSEGYFGENYDEERTPDYVLPDRNNWVIFVLQNLSTLYHSLTYEKVTTFMSYNTKEVPDWRIAGSFMTVMDKYFMSREITVSTIFACLCWVKSVGALQGHGDINKNAKLTLKQTANLLSSIDATVAKGAVKDADKELYGFLIFYSAVIRKSAQNDHLAYTNPLFAGLTMLDHHLEYMDLASEVMAIPKLYEFGHAYNALVNEGLCRRIPFFEEFLTIYEPMIFTPSRAAAVRGAYYRTLLLALGVKATSLEAVARGKSARVNTDSKPRTKLFLKDVSKIFRLMTTDDKSFLRAGSSKALLQMAADICSKELFDTRVLSRDMFKLHDDLTDTFSEMCSELVPREGRYPNDEDEVTLRLLRICDALRPDGQLDVRSLPGNSYPGIELISDKRARASCRAAAEVIEARFGDPKVCERYFIFPSQREVFSERKQSELDPSGSICSVVLENTNADTSKVTSKKRKNRKSKKKNKKDKMTGDGNTTSEISGIGADDNLAEVSSMLKQLLVSASTGSNVQGNTDESDVTVLEDSLRKTMSDAFNRLRDPNILPCSKADDVQCACNAIEKLQELVEKYSDPSRINQTSLQVRNLVFAESARVIHLMQRFHRTDHPAVTVPAVEKVRDLCSTGVEFTQFALFTAQVGVSVGQTSQAREILDLLEKRFLKLRQIRFHSVKVPHYRQLVQLYSTARDEMGLGRTSNSEAFRNLEWYLTDTVDDANALRGLDAIDGYPFYSELVTMAFQNTSTLEEILYLWPRIACFGECVKHIVFGGSKEEVIQANETVIKLGKSLGVEFSERNTRRCTPSIRVGEFKFSSAGIFRDTTS